MASPARKSVPISPEVARSLALIRTAGTDEAKAAADLIGSDATAMSEAQTLAVMIDLGRRLIEEKAREESYRRLTAIDTGDPDRDRDRTAFLTRRARRERLRAEADRSGGS